MKFAVWAFTGTLVGFGTGSWDLAIASLCALALILQALDEINERVRK
jgi:hypothetical protein